MKTSEKIIYSPTGHMADLLKRLKIIASEDSSILFIGETGTGKELLSDDTVNHSERKTPYHQINCVGLSESVIESELFGHIKGAFTGATENKTGYIEASDKGTLLLDELGALDKKLQAKLLRVIEQQEFQKVGGTETQKIKVRFIAATNREKEIIDDLKARFKYQISVKPLRERKEDIPYLLQHFLKKTPFESIEIEALWCLMQYDWKANIRELKNVLADAEVNRQVKESDNPGDPSNRILCGFHLPSDVTDNFHMKFDKLRQVGFHEMIKTKYPVKSFRSNIAASYWTHEHPEFIIDNSCLCLDLNSDFIRVTFDMSADCAVLLDDNIENKIDRYIDGEIKEEDLYPYIARELDFNKKPAHLFDLPWKQAKEKFPLIYYLENRKKYPDLNKNEFAKKIEVGRKTLRAWEAKVPKNQLESSKKQDKGK